MKAVILAGGRGTRISEESFLKPKPMIEIGGKPIIWHIMKIYSAHGIDEFVVCLGYKGYVIKEYFANYFLHMSDVTIDMGSNSIEVHHRSVEPWKVTLVDTGEDTQTGGRLHEYTIAAYAAFCASLAMVAVSWLRARTRMGWRWMEVCQMGRLRGSWRPCRARGTRWRCGG